MTWSFTRADHGFEPAGPFDALVQMWNLVFHGVGRIADRLRNELRMYSPLHHPAISLRENNNHYAWRNRQSNSSLPQTHPIRPDAGLRARIDVLQGLR